MQFSYKISVTKNSYFRNCIHTLMVLMVLMFSYAYSEEDNRQNQYPYLIFASPENENGSFENIKNELPKKWTVIQENHLTWKNSSSQQHSGKYSLQLNIKPCKNDTLKPKMTRMSSEPIAVQVGDAVKYNAWLLTSHTNDTVPNVFVESLEYEKWIVLKPQPHKEAIPTNEWFPMGMTAIIPAGTTHIRLVAQFDCTQIKDNTTWYIDDFFCSISSFSQYVKENMKAQKLKNILLWGVDTLRQSPLGCYGNKSNHTPNIDTIAQDGIFFKHVFTAAPWTRPSFASIFTSTYPSQHTAEHHNSLLPNDISTLAQMMQKQGYFTVGFAKTRFDGFVGPGAGFAKGFDVYFHYDDAKEVNKAFDNYLANNSEAFSRIGGGGVFIFHHFFDPHAPYENHFPEIIKNKGLLGDAKLQGTLLWEKLYPQSPGSANGKDIEYAVKVYESESAYVDTTIGTAITRLKDYKIYKDLNIIICADHGESFNEKYGVWNHGNPYATCTRVPLILRFPKTITPVPLIDNILISNLDIMPTILELAEIPIPNTLEGQSLLNLEDIDNNRFCISEDLKNGSLAIRNIRYKLVAIPAALPMVDHIDPYKFWKSIQPGTSDHAVTRNELESLREWIILRKNSPTKYELYDLILDPFENRDIATEEENIFHILYLELLRHCLKTGIITSDNLQWIREGSISNTEMESLKTVHISNGYQPEYLDLQEDTIEALKAQGYL